MSISNCQKIQMIVQRGSTLIEVMVALLVLAVGLLGFAAMQTQGLLMGRKAHTSSQAIFLAEDIVERMRANRSALASYSMAFGSTPVFATDCAASKCSATQMAAWDRANWFARIKGGGAVLPGGDAQVTVSNVAGIDEVVVEIRYILDKDRDAASDTGVAADSTFTYQLRTQI